MPQKSGEGFEVAICTQGCFFTFFKRKSGSALGP